jgi:hypothetical protein
MMSFTLNLYFRGAMVFDRRALKSEGRLSVLFVDAQRPGSSTYSGPLLPHFAQLIVDPRNLKHPDPEKISKGAWVLQQVSDPEMGSYAKLPDIEKPGKVKKGFSNWHLDAPKLSFPLECGLITIDDDEGTIGKGKGRLVVKGEDDYANIGAGRLPDEDSFYWVPSIAILHADGGDVPELWDDECVAPPFPCNGIASRLDLTQGTVSCARVSEEEFPFKESGEDGAPEVHRQRVAELVCCKIEDLDNEVRIEVGNQRFVVKPGSGKKTLDVLFVNDPIDVTVNPHTYSGDDYEVNYIPFRPGGYKKRVMDLSPLDRFLDPAKPRTNFPYSCPPTTKP